MTHIYNYHPALDEWNGSHRWEGEKYHKGATSLANDGCEIGLVLVSGLVQSHTEPAEEEYQEVTESPYIMMEQPRFSYGMFLYC